MFSVTVRKRFSAAHALAGYAGPCERFHGHNFRVEAEVAGEALDGGNMLVDFVALDAALERAVAPLDHAFLNDLPAFRDGRATAEALARHLYEALARDLALPAGVALRTVTVFETDDYRATYSRS